MADHLNGLGSITEIFRKKINWAKDLSAEFAMARDVFGFPGSVQETIFHSENRPIKYELSITAKSKQEEYDLINFFNGKQGKYKKFWLPAQISMFSLYETIQSGATVIRIKKSNFYKKYKGIERACIELTSGDILTYKITDAYDGPQADQETIEIGTATDRAIFASDILRFGLMTLVRFDTDKLELNFFNDLLSETSLTVIELTGEYPA